MDKSAFQCLVGRREDARCLPVESGARQLRMNQGTSPVIHQAYRRQPQPRWAPKESSPPERMIRFGGKSLCGSGYGQSDKTIQRRLRKTSRRPEPVSIRPTRSMRLRANGGPATMGGQSLGDATRGNSVEVKQRLRCFKAFGPFAMLFSRSIVKLWTSATSTV